MTLAVQRPQSITPIRRPGIQLGTKKFYPHPKQIEGFQLLKRPDVDMVNFYGSAGSGKTLIICLYLVLVALHYPGSKIAIGRYSRQSAKTSVWRQQLQPVFLELQKMRKVIVNKSEMVAEFSNGSYIGLFGLQPDDVQRGSLLTTEWDRFYAVEANENQWPVIEDILTRVRGIKAGTAKTIFDMNPTTFGSWDYFVFQKHQDPLSKEEKYHNAQALQFKVSDNPDLPIRYINVLKNLSPAKRARYFDGEYTAGADALFDVPKFFNPTEFFERFRKSSNETLDDLKKRVRFIGALDPAFTALINEKHKKKDPDYSAFIVGALVDRCLYMFAGYLWREQIKETFQSIKKIYDEWGLVKVVYEANGAQIILEDGFRLRGIRSEPDYSPTTKSKHAKIMDDLDGNWYRIFWSEEFNTKYLPFFTQVLSYTESENIKVDAPDASSNLARHVFKTIGKPIYIGG